MELYDERTVGELPTEVLDGQVALLLKERERRSAADLVTGVRDALGDRAGQVLSVSWATVWSDDGTYSLGIIGDVTYGDGRPDEVIDFVDSSDAVGQALDTLGGMTALGEDTTLVLDLQAGTVSWEF